MGANSSDLRGVTADQVTTLIAEYFRIRRLTLSQAFAFLDRDASKSLSWDEFACGINLCLANTNIGRVSNAELWPIFKLFDRRNRDRITLDDFKSVFSRSRYGTAGYYWYEDDMLRPLITNVGSTPLVAPDGRMLAASPAQCAEDVICRIAHSIVRAGISPLLLFRKVDQGRKGRLTWTELEHVITGFQPDLSMIEKQAIFQRFDMDGTGDIDAREFCDTLNGCNLASATTAEIKLKELGDRFRATGQTVSDLLYAFDRNCDGCLTRDEWYRAMKTFDGVMLTLSDADIEAAFRRFDANGDGMMSIEEFEQFFRFATSEPQSMFGSMLRPRPYGAISRYPAYPVEQPWETAVLDMVRSCLSAERSGMQITDVFRRLDVDGSGLMTPVEFQRMIGTYRKDLSPMHMNALFHKVNISGSGAISMSEFIRRFG